MRNAGHVSRLIGLAGFEPATPSPPDLYAKPLRYSPRLSASYSLWIFCSTVIRQKMHLSSIQLQNAIHTPYGTREVGRHAKG